MPNIGDKLQGVMGGRLYDYTWTKGPKGKLEWVREDLLAAMMAEPSTVSESKAPAVTEDDAVTPEWKACLLIGESLGKDEGTLKEICPKCGGGDSRDKAFTISRDSAGYLYWRCFRASCGYRGSTGGGSKGKRTASREASPLTDKLVPLVEDQIDYFSDEYGVDEYANNIYWCPEREAYAFNVRNPLGSTLGHQLRWYDGRKPKSLSYPVSRTQPFMASYVRPGAKSVVVVEDSLSALKVRSSGVTAVALLGTHIDYERAYELRTVSDNLILALDKGTLPLALSYRDKFGDLFTSVTVWSLDKDLKYVTKERIYKALVHGDTDFITSR